LSATERKRVADSAVEMFLGCYARRG